MVEFNNSTPPTEKIVATGVAVSSPPSTPSSTPQPISSEVKPIQKDGTDRLLNLLFRIGFASIFLINFVNGVLEPEVFKKLLESNVFIPAFMPLDLLIKIAYFNDLFIGILILSGWKQKWILAWAGFWFLVVAMTKIGHFLA